MMVARPTVDFSALIALISYIDLFVTIKYVRYAVRKGFVGSGDHGIWRECDIVRCGTMNILHGRERNVGYRGYFVVSCTDVKRSIYTE